MIDMQAFTNHLATTTSHFHHLPHEWRLIAKHQLTQHLHRWIDSTVIIGEHNTTQTIYLNYSEAIANAITELAAQHRNNTRITDTHNHCTCGWTSPTTDLHPSVWATDHAQPMMDTAVAEAIRETLLTHLNRGVKKDHDLPASWYTGIR